MDSNGFLQRQQEAYHANRFLTYEGFLKLTGGSLKNAYDILGGYFNMAIAAYKRHVIQKTCPACGGVLQYQMFPEPLTRGNVGATARWSCAGDTCVYEEYEYASPEVIFNTYAKPISEAAYISLKDDLADDDFYYNTTIASIYNGPPISSNRPKQVPDWVRRKCPKCGTGLLFYPSHQNKSGVTGVFACPNGWADNDDPETWCGYEEIVTTPIEDLFREYYSRTSTKAEAARGLLRKECPLCGADLIVRPVENNARGIKTRWYCPTGFNYDDPDALCGYEEFSTEPISTFIKSINKYFADNPE